MGSTNHGTQAITWQYFMDAKAYDFNKKDVNVLPRGIYQGGHLTRVTNSEIKLLPLTVVLGDNDVQVSVKTEVFALLNADTLDSGTISIATPYIVLRWAFAEFVSNYMEVHALALGDIQTNDIVVGKCVISGGGVLDPVFDYTSRTFLNVQNIVLRVEESEVSELYVWVRAGRLQTTAQTISIAEQKIGPFTNPGSPNSRIDLVYIDIDGSIKIQPGTAAVSPTVPAYAGKMVIAEVRLVNGESYIPVSRIIDVRSSWIKISTSFGANVSKNKDTVYSAETDGILVVITGSMDDGQSTTVYSDANADPTTIVGKWYSAGSISGGNIATITVPILKDKKYKVVGSTTPTSIKWYPLGT